MSVKIRQAKLDDIPFIMRNSRRLCDFGLKVTKTKEIKKLYRLDKKNAPNAWKKYFTEKIKDKDSSFIVLEDEGKLIGHGIFCVEEWPPVFKHKKIGNVRELFLQKPYRNQGLGGKILKNADQFFKKKKVKFSIITVDRANARAGRVYRRHGFNDFRHLLVKELK